MEEGAKTKLIHWHKDVCAEATCRCGKSSVALLIDWLTVDAGAGYPNYARWKCGSKAKAGQNKLRIAGEISSDLLKHGLHRSDKSVKAKIEELETKYGNVLDKYGSGIDQDETILGDLAPIRAPRALLFERGRDPGNDGISIAFCR
ncbi:hypothetical protein SPRG_09699 [Saprolegnia parasitica CBS 223.65]|uniref:Uncharacterized protein n=1 Tax=Saprolegnia parasitica (strain CBS 223.65) TaxID=695850 RepID=A0A067C353_SAPPC|nr:hypothetical protein SPRG_09699 [Saprolegnia parasitica CBS 223.65]KDO24968.1 hypothetical protein SPRG_09699 [Saprolegnia parasitica CBS 223.65]|eukprot:XP_012204239.1 hypothetical protein SPRG_09699 [Saprolegnia parasitica CBS 223.65]